LQCEDTRLVALQLSDEGAKRWAHIIRHRANELLKNHDSVSDVHGLASPSSEFPYFRPGLCESTISVRCCGQPKIPSCIDPLDWLTKDLYWQGMLEISQCLKEEQRDVLLYVEGDWAVLSAVGEAVEMRGLIQNVWDKIYFRKRKVTQIYLILSAVLPMH